MPSPTSLIGLTEVGNKPFAHQKVTSLMRRSEEEGDSAGASHLQPLLYGMIVDVTLFNAILSAPPVSNVVGVYGVFDKAPVMALPTLRALFIQQLRLMYSGEHQLSKSLPKILQGVCSGEVKSLVREYQLQVEERCERLEGIAKLVKENLGGERCGVMEAFTRHAISLSELRGDERVLDLALMTTLRQVGHFEKSGYELVRSFADVLGEEEVLKTIDGMLSQTEDNERALILLSEDMMDTTSHARSTQEYGVFRVMPRDLAS